MPLGASANSARHGVKKPGQSKQARAGLTFPVARMQTKLKQKRVALRIGGNAGIYLAAVAEHVVMHILEAAHEHSSAKGDKTRRLTINDLVQAVRTDPDTARLFADFSFSTHTSVIKPRKVQKIIMTPKDWAALQAKKAAKAQSAPPAKGGSGKKKP